MRILFSGSKILIEGIEVKDIWAGIEMIPRLGSGAKKKDWNVDEREGIISWE